MTHLRAIYIIHPGVRKLLVICGTVVRGRNKTLTTRTCLEDISVLVTLMRITGENYSISQYNGKVIFHCVGFAQFEHFSKIKQCMLCDPIMDR